MYTVYLSLSIYINIFIVLIFSYSYKMRCCYVAENFDEEMQKATTTPECRALGCLTKVILRLIIITTTTTIIIITYTF